MVSLPPTSLPPVPVALPAAPPPPVIVPAQVVAANLQVQLLRELTLPVSAVTVTQPPVPPPPTPSPAQQILNAAAPAPSATPATLPPAQLLLQIQTPQGTVQLSIPAQLALPAPQQPGQPAALPTTLTAPQWQQLVDQGHVQLQIAPVPAALLQRLAPNGITGTPPLLAQLIIPPRDLAKLLGTPAPAAPVAQTPTGLALGTTPASFTATLLPPALAESYKARFATAPEQGPQLQPTPGAQKSIVQNAVTSVRSWFDAIRPAATQAQPQTQTQTPARIEPSLAQPKSIAAAPPPGPANPLPVPPTVPAAASTATAPLRQVTITLIANPAPAQFQPAPQLQQSTPLPPNTTETPARLLGLTPAGEKLVEIDDGQVLLAPAALPLAPGKPATLRIASPLDANITLQPERTPTLAATQPALHETLEALTAAAPALAARLASQLLIQPAAPMGTLAPALLFLLSAVGLNTGGTPAKTTSPALAPALRAALDAIDSTRGAAPGTIAAPPPLAERLLTELRQLGAGREVLDDSGQPWHGFTLPTVTGEALQTPVNFYIQQPQPRLPDAHDRTAGQTPAGALKQTRFIVDMQLSRLGTTQLEGLSRARQLDLTLRTHTALPVALQSDLTARYTEIAAATGLTGTLQFGAGRWFAARETAGTSHMNARL